MYLNGITGRAMFIVILMFALVVIVGLVGLAVEYTKPGTDTDLIKEIMKYIFLIGTGGAVTNAAGDIAREIRNPGSASRDTSGTPRNTQPNEPQQEAKPKPPGGGIGWGKDG